MCLWGPGPSLWVMMAQDCPELYPGKTYWPRAVSMFIPMSLSVCVILALSKSLLCARLHGPASATSCLTNDIDTAVSLLWNEDNNRSHGHQSGSAKLCCSNEHLPDLGGLKWLQSHCKVPLGSAKGTGLCCCHCHSGAQIDRTTITWNTLVSRQRKRKNSKVPEGGSGNTWSTAKGSNVSYWCGLGD